MQSTKPVLAAVQAAPAFARLDETVAKAVVLIDEAASRRSRHHRLP